MLSLRTSNIEWPLGNHPHWELDNVEVEDAEEAEDSGIKSVAESLIVLQSLRQSRDKWLKSTFPKFSSKSRGGKPAEIVPPPHTIHNRGKCDIEIGPHIFSNTVVFEVNYQYIPSASKPLFAYPPPAGQTSSWQATTPYGSFNYTPYGQHVSESTSSKPAPAASTTTEATGPQTSSTPLSSLDSSVSITPSLISQVNSAASSNATLASLLQLAASGKATPEQLKTLGLLIQSLAAPPNAEGSTDKAGTASTSAMTARPSTSALISASQASTSSVSLFKSSMLQPVFTPLKEFDIVLEFSENPSDRWILPRAPVVIERTSETGVTSDILLTASVPFTSSPIPGAEKESTTLANDSAQQLVTFRFVKASSDIWSCISRWAGAQEKMETTRKAFQRLLAKEPERFYLAHQLPAGALLTQIQNSAMPPYTMKSLRLTQADRAKPKRVRKPAVRKPAVRKPTTDKDASTEPQKRKRQAKVQPSLPKVACVTCGQTDVPLTMGGRYCPSCAKSAMPTFPELPSNSSTFIHKFWAAPKPDVIIQPPSIGTLPSQLTDPSQLGSKRKKSIGQSADGPTAVDSPVQQVDVDQSSSKRKKSV